jgi:hypothetical protein
MQAGQRRAGAVVRVEVLYFDGCPGAEELLPRLRELLARAGALAEIELRRVESAQAAISARFLGSPTVRVDGVDIEPGARGRTDYGLKCRLYRASGGVRGTPPDEWILAALDESRSRDDGD